MAYQVKDIDQPQTMPWSRSQTMLKIENVTWIDEDQPDVTSEVIR